MTNKAISNVESPNGYINELIKMYDEESYKMSVVDDSLYEREELRGDCN